MPSLLPADTIPTMPAAEQHVRTALVVYKQALIQAHHRRRWHRLAAWLGDPTAREAQAALDAAEAHARRA